MFRYSHVNYIFGSPGSGKSCVLAMICKYFTKKGVKVFSNYPIEGAILINDEDVGYYSFKNSILLVDEAGICYNNRDAVSKRGLLVDKQRLSYWKLIRHDRCIAFIASQSWDEIDKKLRDLATAYFLIKKYNFFTLIKPIYKKVDIDDTTHQPCDFFVFDMIWNWRLCLRSKYYKMFDSYTMPPLPEYPLSQDTSALSSDSTLIGCSSDRAALDNESWSDNG